jgi:predicted phosphodiesterase
MTMTATGTSDAWDVRGTYGVDNILVDESDPAGIFYMNSVEVTGLAPATCYLYTITGYAERGGRFCTMHVVDDHTTPISFFVIGDTNPILTHTGRILEAGEPESAEFSVHVGDLQYYDSILETYQVWFPMMEQLLSAGSMFPCVGNHELEIDFELEDYYSRFWEDPGHDGDSIRYHFATGGVHFFSLSTEHDLLEGSEQYEWFTARIAEVEAEPDYRFSILFLHRPLYTVGDSTPILDVREALAPILAANNVPLVLAGHMHGYERFEVGDITYVTSGSGGGTRGDIDENVLAYPEDAMLRVASGRYFESMIITIEGDAIRAVTKDDLGMVQDSFEKTVVLGPRMTTP